MLVSPFAFFTLCVAIERNIAIISVGIDTGHEIRSIRIDHIHKGISISFILSFPFCVFSYYNVIVGGVNMKKKIVALCASLVVVLLSTVVAYAGYSPVISANNGGYIIAQKLQAVGNIIVDVSPSAASFTYKVTIGYDSLSDLCATANGYGVTCSLYYNSTQGLYVVRVHDGLTIDQMFDFTSTYGVLANSDGYVYTAQKEESGGNTTSNTYNFNQTIINNSTGTASSSPGYGGNVSSSTSDRDLQEDIYFRVWYVGEYVSILTDWTKFIYKTVNNIFNQLDNNVVPALEAVNSNLISFKDGVISSIGRLDIGLMTVIGQVDTIKDLSYRTYSGVSGLIARLDTLITNSNTLITNSAGIGSRLDSIINNGAVQVNTSSIDARLDKLISMYSKVNSVVLDTAAVNGGQITGAVGGALQDVMIYGRTRRENSQLTTTLPGLSVNGTPFVLGNTPLRSVHFTASVPAYITNDADLAAGVWKAGTYNYVSDTYNASTGEYVQRINAITLTGEETWSMATRAGSSSIFYTPFTGSNLRAESNLFNYVVPSTDFTQASANVDALGAAFTIYSNALRFVSPVASVDAWKTYLKNRVAEGNPVTVFWVPDPATEGTGTVSSWYADAATITIPEGDSTITADGLRVTGKYETYDSYTKTADIIAAINNIPPYDDSGLIAAITGMGTPTVTTDLTEVMSRLDLILGELQSTSGSATCEHIYAQHMEQDADCTLPGLMISTCSKCGDSYSEIVDPLGHDWVVSSHVDAVTDPDTGEETASAYDVYTCSRCDRTYEDHTGDGAPNEDYSNTSISKLVVQVFSKLGTFAGKLIGFFVHLLDKALTSVDNVISKFNDYTAQITGFGGSYTTWLTGFWGIIPAELQIALTFSVICMALGAVGKRLLFS